MSAHTPGPWAVSQNTHLVFGRADGPGLEPIGFVYGPSFADQSAVGLRAMADCRLIAAAPEMFREVVALYAELADIRNDWPRRHTAQGQQRLSRLLALVAKASGEDEQAVQDKYSLGATGEPQ